ncbi:hypothetical protein [Nocardia xishanensis]|uniref:hypothetical protein n=1 Tax=Nocardia xishanensis TaxID=238964 RepID=UPI00083279AF|nr:hypothetical protein [Nocardia xishanensis]
MTEQRSIKYAIRQPDGRLVYDYPGNDPEDGVAMWISASERAYVWDTLEEAEQARRVIIEYISRLGFGLAYAFRAHSQVTPLRIVTTVELLRLEEVDDPKADAEVADVTELRTWPRAEDVPMGVKFKGIGEASIYVWQRSEDIRFAVSTTPENPSAEYLYELDIAYPDGFVEVLP